MTRALRQTSQVLRRGKAFGRTRLLCCSALGLVLAAVEMLPAQAAPAGASVPSGVAAAPSITSSGPVTDVKLNQSRTLIDWSSFQIANGETVNFRFNNGSDIVLNRVLGQAVIDGALNGLVGAKTGGNVWIYGGQGVVFGANARVNVGSLMATTTPLSSVAEFLSGSNTFTFQGGQSDASILARGGAQLAAKGALALIAPSVATEAGAKVSAGGTALYGSAQNFRIHFGEGAGGNLDLVDFEVPASALEDGSVSATPLAIAGDTVAGKAMFAAVNRPSVMNAVISLGGLVTAQGAVQGDGGDIILSATGGAAAVKVGGALQADRSVSMTAPGGKIEVGGTVTARDASGQGGTIALGDGGTSAVQLDSGSRLDVASVGVGQAGGRATVTAKAVDVEGAIDASGPAGGGEIRVGGGFHGQDATVANADYVSVAPWAVLTADATAAGDGGSVVAWSQKATDFRGLIQARGGQGGGAGGQAEVSSKGALNYVGLADLRAPQGITGGLLLDPTTIDIKNVGGGASDYKSATDGDTFAPGANSTVDTDEIVKQIKTAVLTISADGLFTFDDTVTYNNATDSALLTLQAGGGFKFNADPFAVTGVGVLNVTMTSAFGGAHSDFTLGAGRTLTVGGGALTINADSISLAGSVTGGQVNLASTSGSVSGAGAITTTAGLNASATGGSVSLNGGSNAVSGTIVLAGDNVTFDNNQTTAFTPGNITVNGTGSLSLSTTTGDLSFTGPLTTPGAMILSAAGTLTTPALTATTGGLSLTGGVITLGGGVVASSGSISLTAPALAVGQTLQASQTVTLLATTGDITQSAAITAAGLSATSTAGNINLNAANAISGTVANLSGGNVVLVNGGALTVLGSGVSAAGALNLTSSTGLLSVTGNMTAGGDITLTGTGVSLGGTLQSTGGFVSLDATAGGLALGHTVQASTAVTLQATGDITQTAAITTADLSASSSAGDVNLNSTGNNISGTVQALSGAHVTLVDNAATMTVNGAGMSAANDLNLTANNALSVTGAISTAGNVSLTGASVTLGGQIQSTAGGVAIDATNASLTITPASDVSAATYIHLTAAGPSGLLTVTSPLTATGDVVLSGNTLSLSGVTTSLAGGVSLSTTGGPMTVDPATISAATFITLSSSDILTVLAPVTATGNVSLTGTSLFLSGPTVSLAGGVALNSTVSPLTVNPLFDISAATFVTLTSGNTLFVTGPLITTGTTTLSGSSLILGGTVQSVTGDVNLTSTASPLGLTQFVSAAGAVNLAAFGDITQSIEIVSSSISAAATGGGSVVLTSPFNAFSTVSGLSGANISLSESQSFSVNGAGLSTGGALNLTSGNQLSVTTPLSTAGNIFLTGSTLSLGGQIQSTAGGVSLTATGGGLTVDPATGISAATFVTLAASGALNLTGGLTAPGAVSLTGSSISLGGGVRSLNSTLALNATGSALAIGQTLQANGAVSLTAGGDITQTAKITANGLSATANSGGAVNLGLASNAITGTVSSLSGSAITLVDNSAATINTAGLSTAGPLVLTSNGQLTLSGGLILSGSISLTGSSLSLGGAVQSTLNAVTLDATGAALAVNQQVSANTAVHLLASGNISQTSLISAGNGFSADSSGGSVNLGLGNSIGGTVSSLTGSSITLNGAPALSVNGAGVTTGGGLTLSSSNALTVNGALTAGGNLSLTGSGLSLGGQVQSTGGDVTLHATAAGLNLNQAVLVSSGVLHLQAAGDITQTVAFTTGGLTASTTGNVTLTAPANVISGTVSSLTGSNVNLHDSQAMTVTGPGVSVTGDLTLSSDGVLTVNNTLAAGGNVSLTGTSLNTDTVNAGLGLSETSTTGNLSTGVLTANGNIGLTGHTLTVTGAVTSNTGSVTLGSTTGGLALAHTIQAATSVTLNAHDDITQTAAVIAGNGLSATSTNGNINLTLNSPNNAITGPVSLSGANVALRDGLALNVQSVSASGTLDLTSVAALSVTGGLTAGGDISLAGTSLSLGGSVLSTGGGVTLDSTASALTINQAVTAGAGKTVNLVSSGVVSQTGAGLITAAKLAGVSVGGTTLTLPNPIGSLGTFSNSVSGDIRINSTLDLGLTGAISNPAGGVWLTAKSLAVDSPITGGSYIILQSSNGGIAGAGVLTATTVGMAAQAIGGPVSLTGVNHISNAIILGGDGVTFVNGQSINISAGDLTSTAGASLTTTAGDITVNGAVNLPGSITLAAAGVLTTPAITTTAGNVSLTGASIALGGDIQAGAGNVGLNSTGTLTLNHNITAGGTATLVSGAQVVEDASGSAVTAGHLAVSAASGIAMNNANVVPAVDSLVNTGAGGISFRDTAANVTLGTVSTGGGAVQVTTTGNLALNSAISVPAALVLNAGGSLTGGALQAVGGMTLAGVSGVTLGALTLGGNLSLTSSGAVAVSQIQGQAASQLALSGANVTLGAAAGATPGAGQSVQGTLSVTATQDATVNLSGNVNVAQITAGHAASVTARNGSAQVASATLGASGASLAITATGATGDAVLGAAAGVAPAAGNIVTAPAGAAISVNGGRDAVVNLAGPVTVANLTGARDAIAHTTAGDLAVATAQANRNLTAISDSGSAYLKTATLTGVGTLTLQAAKTATLGRLPGEAAPTPAGTLTLDPDVVTVTGQTVVVDLTGDAVLTSVQSTGGDATVSASGALNITQASSSANLALKSGAAATVGTATAGTSGSIISGGAITVGSLTAPTLLLRGQALTINGGLTATQACATACTTPTLTIESAGGGLNLGNVATGAVSGMTINNAQYALIKADGLTLYAGDTTKASARGNVAIGDLTLDGTKVKTLTVLAGPNAKVNVVGAVLAGAGGGSALVIGNADSATGWTPGSIYITGDKGGLGEGAPNVPLASEKPLSSVTLNAVGDVLFGRDSFITAITGVEAAGHANTINVDRNIPPGVGVVGTDLNRVFVTADTMTIRANGVIAQENTGITGTSNGIILTNRNQARFFATLGRTGPPAAGQGLAPLIIDLSLAYFNSAGLFINQQIAAASPGVDLGSLPRSDVYRINGCTIGAAGSCTPLPNTIVDISIGKLVQDIRLIAQAPPPAYDPTITGAGNEEIWRTNSCSSGQTNGNGQCQ